MILLPLLALTSIACTAIDAAAQTPPLRADIPEALVQQAEETLGVQALEDGSFLPPPHWEESALELVRTHFIGNATLLNHIEQERREARAGEEWVDSRADMAMERILEYGMGTADGTPAAPILCAGIAQPFVTRQFRFATWTSQPSWCGTEESPLLVIATMPRESANSAFNLRIRATAHLSPTGALECFVHLDRWFVLPVEAVPEADRSTWTPPQARTELIVGCGHPRRPRLARSWTGQPTTTAAPAESTP